MKTRGRSYITGISVVACALAAAGPAIAEVPLGGFIPFVGIGLTRQFKDSREEEHQLDYAFADASNSWSGTPLGAGGTPYFDLALLDTGAATHILTQTAANNSHFGIHVAFTDEPDGFGGSNEQTIFGATGAIDLLINDPLGVYMGGLANSSVVGTKLIMNTTFLRGQTSVATLEAPSSWKLPNIIGLPMAAQQGIIIRNSQPQIFQFDDGSGARTVRSPQVDLIPLGTGSQQSITRRAALRLQPSASFIAGPAYLPGFDLSTLSFHEDPTSPSVVENGGLFLDVDVTNDGNSLQDKRMLFDTGADLTVFSDVFAASVGLDITQKTPDFYLEVEGSGGVVPGVPGYYLDELKIDAVGGPIILHDVPIAVLNVPNPTEPANDIDAILGMHLFTGRDLVIDAIPSAKGNGASPRLYISDPVTETHTWAAAAPSGTWSTISSWSSATTAPGNKWIADVRNTTSNDKTANVTANSTVFQTNVTATSTGRMIVQVQDGVTLTTFGEARIDAGGTIAIAATGKLDAQFVNIQGGTLAGEGSIFVGSGPINGVVRNLSGRVAPGQLGTVDPIGQLSITGDFSNLGAGTLAIDLAGTTAITQYDRLDATRYAFLGGTLEVSLVGFTPSVGNSFTIITTGPLGVSGKFQNLVLPAGFLWNVAYNTNNVVLRVTGIGQLGDFNSDGKVSAADYVTWRKSAGTSENYQLWRNNFGLPTSGSGAGAFAAVPEPAPLFLTALAACVVAAIRKR